MAGGAILDDGRNVEHLPDPSTGGNLEGNVAVAISPNSTNFTCVLSISYRSRGVRPYVHEEVEGLMLNM